MDERPGMQVRGVGDGPEVASAAAPGRVRVLVVEDDAMTRRAIVRALRRAWGATQVEVVEATNGEAALALLVGQCPDPQNPGGWAFDCVLLDYHLTGIDGLEVLRQVLAAGVRTPIVMLTAKGDEALVVEVMRAGAADYLSKSRLSPESLGASLRHVLGTRQAQREAEAAREQMRLSEARYRALVETNPDGIIVHDGRMILYANPAVARMLGAAAAEELVGRALMDLVDPTDRDAVAGRIADIATEGKPAPLRESRLLRVDGGGVVDAEVLATACNYGGQSAVQAVARDISARKEAQRALHRSEMHYQVLVDSVDGIVWEAQGEPPRFTFVSQQARRLLGYEVERWYEQDFWPAHLHPDDRERAISQCATATAAGLDHELEYRILAADGRVVWLRDLVSVVESAGPATRLRGVMFDVTQRRQSQQAVLHSEARLKVLNQIATGIIWGVPLAQVIERTVQMLGREFPGYRVALARIGADGLLEVTHAVEPAGMPAARGSASSRAHSGAYLTLLRRGEALVVNDVREAPALSELVESFEEYGTRAALDVPIFHGGKLVAALFMSAPVPTAWSEHEVATLAQTAEYLAVAYKDSVVEAQRAEAEAALRGSEVRFRRLYEANIVGIIFWNLDGSILAANDEFLRTVGYTRDDLDAGRVKWTAMTPPEWLEGDQQALRIMEQTGTCPTFEKEYFRKDGTRAQVVIGGALLEGSDQEGIAFVTDLSERNVLREQLLQAQKMEAVGRLAGGVAHDFNNLLAVIGGYAESLTRRVPASSPLLASATEIQKAADRGAALIRQLLAFSRRQVARPQELDLSAVVGNVRDMLATLVGSEWTIVVERGDQGGQERPGDGGGLWKVRADAGQMEQVLVNLVLNARDAMSGGGKIVIRTANVRLDSPALAASSLRPGRYAKLSVIDVGVGMDAQVQARIFEPFFTTKEMQGTGLGLSIVYGIVQEAGGAVLVHSAKGKGSVFDVLLPAVG